MANYRYPPSYYRYQEKCPTVSVRLSKELKEVLDEIRSKTGMSYADIVRKILRQDFKEIQEVAFKKGYEKGLKEGYERGLQECRERSRKELEECRVSLKFCMDNLSRLWPLPLPWYPYYYPYYPLH